MDDETSTWIRILTHLDPTAAYSEDDEGIRFQLRQEAMAEAYVLLVGYADTIIKQQQVPTALEAGDLASQVLVKLFHPGRQSLMERLRLTRSPGGYLTTVIKHLVIADVRSHKRRGQLAKQHMQARKQSYETSDYIADVEVMTRHFLDAVSRLSLREQQLLRKKLSGVPLAQIAEEDDVSVSVVAVRITRALKKLRQYASPTTLDSPYQADEYISKLAPKLSTIVAKLGKDGAL